MYRSVGFNVAVGAAGAPGAALIVMLVPKEITPSEIHCSYGIKTGTGH